MEKYQEKICDYLDRLQIISMLLYAEEIPLKGNLSIIDKLVLARNLAIEAMTELPELYDPTMDLFHWLRLKISEDPTRF